MQTGIQNLAQRSLLALVRLITLVAFALARSFTSLAFQSILDVMNGSKNVNVDVNVGLLYFRNKRRMPVSRRYEYAIRQKKTVEGR